MAWVRVSDDFYDHPRFQSVSPASIGVWLLALAWANRNLSDGRIGLLVVRRLAPLRTAKTAISELTAAGIFEPVDDGFQIRDYLDYQPSREKVLSERAKDRERWHRRSGPTPPRSGGGGSPDSSRTPPASQPQPQPLTATRKPETPIPEIFHLKAVTEGWARAETIAHLDLDLETEKFTNHAIQNDRRCRDWVRAGRNWLISSAERNPKPERQYDYTIKPLKWDGGGL